MLSLSNFILCNTVQFSGEGYMWSLKVFMVFASR
uniref:Uncharacterized protein n=1 Tax=Anguilla anguilla TaxID=7936 RepID=A0A0E9XAF1_ANGAN